MAKSTTFYSIEDIVKGYLALAYACGIYSKAKSKRFPSATNYMGDGFPLITTYEILPRQYSVLTFCGKELINNAQIIYSLDEIKKLFVQKLAGKEPKFKTK